MQNMTSTKQFKRFTKKKFGTLTKFTKLIGMKRYDLQAFIAATEKKMTLERQTELTRLFKLAQLTPVKALETELTEAMCARIGAAIKDRGGVTAFGAKYKIPLSSINFIIGGRRKTISKQVKRICKILKLEV